MHYHDEGSKVEEKVEDRRQLNPVVNGKRDGMLSNEEIDNYSEFDIASRHEDDVEILHTFGIEGLTTVYITVVRKTKDDRWDKEDAEPNALPWISAK